MLRGIQLLTALKVRPQVEPPQVAPQIHKRIKQANPFEPEPPNCEDPPASKQGCRQRQPGKIACNTLQGVHYSGSAWFNFELSCTGLPSHSLEPATISAKSGTAWARFWKSPQPLCSAGQHLAAWLGPETARAECIHRLHVASDVRRHPNVRSVVECVGSFSRNTFWAS